MKTYTVRKGYVNARGVFRPGDVVSLRDKEATPLLDGGLIVSPDAPVVDDAPWIATLADAIEAMAAEVRADHALRNQLFLAGSNKPRLAVLRDRLRSEKIPSADVTRAFELLQQRGVELELPGDDELEGD